MPGIVLFAGSPPIIIPDTGCNGDTDAVVQAARVEIAKIEVLRTRNLATVQALSAEGANFDRRIPTVVRELESISGQLKNSSLPSSRPFASPIQTLPTSGPRYAKRWHSMPLFKTWSAVGLILKGTEDEKAGVVTNADLSSTVAHSFAKTVEGILTGWHFPEVGDVYFDSKSRDLVIAGKSRSAFGRGLRAITHAAFTLRLLAFCREAPHTTHGIRCTRFSIAGIQRARWNRI